MARVAPRARIATWLAATAFIAVVLPAITRPAEAVDPRHVGISLAIVARGLSSPVAIAAPNDGSGRLFILEQAGRIRVWKPGSGLLSTPYLDIHTKVLSGGERGLLGLVFHPRFTSNGFFYVYYTNLNGNIQVSRFHTSTVSSNVAETTEYGIINIAHPTYANHNGGQLQMLGGGYLYIGTGDGGGAGDPSGNAQNLKSFLGKILRIDVDHTCGSLHYCNPSTNPYYGKSYSKYEIWLFGLRNPWRFSFSRTTGNLWIGDVGQNAREEVDSLPAGAKGNNMGWDCFEGTLNTVGLYGGTYCAGKTYTQPVFNYGHTNGRCAIIGGYVYGGTGQSSIMGGLYVYADYCTGELWGLAHSTSGWLNALVNKHGSSITSFGEGANGELYLVDTAGVLYHLNAYKR